ncbi:MAG TPA: HAMP domain-containing protein [Candidatus Avilachnospira avicola]|nr:HAMP domain-containing protein [Candidatus Avilachnospira avicola]
MKHSIRIRFTLIFVGIMAFLLLLMYAVNTLYLADYYFDEKVDSLEYTYDTIDEIVELADRQDRTIVDLVGDEFGQNVTDSPIVSMFRSLNDQSNINVVMIDKNDRSFVAASREGEYMERKLRFFMANREEILDGRMPSALIPDENDDEYSTGIKNFIARFLRSMGYNAAVWGEEGELGPRITTLQVHPDYVVQQNYDRRSGSTYLESWGKFSDGETMFIMSMPLAHIEDSVNITNRFLLIVGILVLVLGSIVIFFTTGAITKPINDLAYISKKMAGLDFGVKYEGKRQDEIGVLGSSMNDMSARLEETIAELKTANLQLQKDIEEKTRIDDMRKDFISNVSHELKTPIALIEGYAEGLTEGIADDEESRKYYCSVIMDEAVKMNKMVKQLTSLTNLEFGNDGIEIKRFDLSALIKSIVEAQGMKTEEKSVKAEDRFPEGLEAWGDEFKIEEVLTNYYTNALNHIDGERRLIISGSESDGKIRVSVYNDGTPIPEEDIPRIWEKFYKVDKARTRAYGGSGIGLSIVKAIMDAHGQACGVINHENGVEFWFELEACEKEDQSSLS